MTQYRTGLQKRDGFALVVIAALFIAFAVVAAAIVERNTALQFISRRDAAKAQLQRLNNAIIEYSVHNASGATRIYPCPAATNLATSNSSFGVSINTAGTQDCSTASGATLTGYGMTIAGTDVVKGMVPVQTLAPYGININDAYDPWNNRIMYAVNRQLTTGGSKSTTNNPAVTDIVTIANNVYTILPTSTKPDFLLLSYGRDGIGAVRRGATTIGLTCPALGPLYAYNCNSGVTNYYHGPTNTATSANSNTYFDDILSWHNQ